jgi:hypothetical protein
MALREELQMARMTESKLSKEVRRLEERLLTSKARVHPPHPQDVVNWNISRGSSRRTGLRAEERAEYEELLREAEQEKAELRRQAERYRKKLVGMHKAAWEDAEGHAPPHASVLPEHKRVGARPRTTAPAQPVNSSGVSTNDVLEHARKREEAARMEWLRVVAKPGGRMDTGKMNALPQGMRSVGVQVSGRERHSDEDEEEALGKSSFADDNQTRMVSALKQELLQQNRRVAQLVEQCNSLQAYVDRVNAEREETRQALLEMDVKMTTCLQERDAVAKERDRLAFDLRMARLDKKAIEQQEAEMLEMRENVEKVEKENMDLTYQTLEAIWKGSIASLSAGGAGAVATAPQQHALATGQIELSRVPSADGGVAQERQGMEEVFKPPEVTKAPSAGEQELAYFGLAPGFGLWVRGIDVQ